MKRTTAIFVLFCCLFGCETPGTGTEGVPDQAAASIPEDPGWKILLQGSGERFQALSIVNDSTIWVSGTNGRFGVTLDGGDSWFVSSVAGADSLEFRDIHAFDAFTAVMMSSGTGSISRIYRTEDGGHVWTEQFVNPLEDGFFDCMDFWDSNRGLVFSDAVDGLFPVFTTSDGGKAWSRVQVEGLPPAFDGEGSFAASGTCIDTHPGGLAWFGTGASRVEARVFRSSDYGNSWAVSTTPLQSDTPSAGTYSVVYRTEKVGFAFGGDYQSKEPSAFNFTGTEDGGKTWSILTPVPLSGAVFGGAVIPGTEALIAVGPTGSVLSRDSGRSWAMIDSLNFWSVGSIGPQSTWAVGPKGTVARLVEKPN